MQTNTEDRRVLLSIQTVIEETGLSISTVNRLLNNGKLERVKFGRATRITAESYRRLLSGYDGKRIAA